LGRLERLAMGLSLLPTPDSGTLFELDSARLIFSLFQATSDHTTKCFVDVSCPSILAELASSMGFQQCFAIWPMDRISHYLDYVRPRLDEKRLRGKGIGFSFYDRQQEVDGSVARDEVDSGFFFDYPRNAQLLVLSVSVSDVCIWKKTLELIDQKTALKHLEVLAVIHDSSSDGDGLLSELQEVGGPLWVLKEELNCRKQINNEHLKVKIFWLGNAKSRSDCLLTRSLQSDILLSILESDTRLGKRLREKLKPPKNKISGSRPVASKMDEELSLSDWNRVSRRLTWNSPDTSWGNALGEGGYGIVLGATKYSPAEIIDLAIKLSVCRNEHYYNVSAWRELNSMVHAKSKSDGNFLKLIDCFVSGNTRLTAALILCRVNDEVIVSALGMERLHQTILPILENACLSYQKQ
jgi:hypothetical protein